MTITTLVIARHGNTFDKADIPTRVGARTDIPLVKSGKEQAARIGKLLKESNILPDSVYSSHLLRTKETAQIAIEQTGYKLPIYPLDIFNEIDYGPDENKTEDEVISRIGKEAIEKWDKEAIVPDGWNFKPEDTIKHWKDFASHIAKDDAGGHILVVTSNGIARFAPYITGDFQGFSKENNIKMSTGAISIFEHDSDTGKWECKRWNFKP